MATTTAWGETLTVLMELGFPIYRFTLGDYGTKVTRTNLLTNPSFETNNTGWSSAQAGGAVRTSSSGYATTYSRTNRVVNPSFEVDLTNWTLTGSVTRITTDSYVGAACAQLAYAGSGTVLMSSANITATAGGIYTLSFYLKQSVDTGSVICNFMFYNASNVLILDDTHQTNNPNTTWQRFSQTRTAPANTAYFQVRIYQTAGEGGGAVATNTLVDAVMVETTTALRPYFDGSTTDAWSGRTLTTALAWSGTANASTSTGTWSYSTSQNVSAYSGAWFGAATMSSTSDSNVFAVPASSWSFASTATYVASAYVYVPVGSTLAGREIRIDFEGGTATGTTGTSSPAVLTAGAWVRVSRPYTVTATGTKAIVFRLSGTISTAVDEPIYLDSVLVEQTNTLRPYFDGSYGDAWSGYILDGALSWSGTAHASTSSGTWGLVGTEINDGTETTDGSVLGEYYLEGTLVGDDVAEYTQQITVNRGRQDQLAAFSAGTCAITLLNNDRRFDPTNESSPYWDITLQQSGVTPRRKVTVRVGDEDIFVGRITDIDLSYATGKSTDISQVTISAADDFVLLANAYTTANLTPTEELSGARLNYLLDLPAIGYTGTRNIDAGTATLGAYQIDANTNALTYAQAIAESEQGYFFVARDGTLTFTDRVSAAFAASVGAFSDDGGTGIKYQTLGIMYGQEFLYNKVVVTRDGGTPQTSNDAASQTEYGISTLSLTNLLLSSDTAAQTLADDLLGLYAQPVYRFDNMSLMVSAFTAGNRVTCNQLELGDVITVERNYQTGTPSTLTKYQSIERLTHSITPNFHRLEVAMADAYVLYPFILDDATYGIMDSNNALT